jgi:hypothetical protein
MNYTTEDLLRDIGFANTSSRETGVDADKTAARTTSRAREVFKKVKSKKVNNSSLQSEEPNGFDSVTSCLASANSIGSSQVARHNEIVSSREIAGITAQHVRTAKGIKVSLSIQTQQARSTGDFASLTAELKRHSRLRELKRYAGDTAVFEQHYVDTVDSLKQLTPEQGRHVCCGRIHQRGKRSAWFADMMVVGTLDTTGTCLESIIVYSGLEEYQIEMRQELTERQTAGYHCAGIYGEIRTNAVVPRLETAARRTF